jgi:hypothetical protein
LRLFGLDPAAVQQIKYEMRNEKCEKDTHLEAVSCVVKVNGIAVISAMRRDALFRVHIQKR